MFSAIKSWKQKIPMRLAVSFLIVKRAGLVADKFNSKTIKRLSSKGKLQLLMSFAGSNAEVADPWYTGNFEATKRDVLAGCSALLNQLKK